MEQLVLLQIDRPLSPAEERALFARVGAEKQALLSRMPAGEARQGRLLAALLARRLCGERLGASPASLQMAVAPGGKPFLADYPALHFNLSHTPGGVLCGLSSRPVGVDIERLRPFPDRVEERCFTLAERAWAGEDPVRRLTVWTRKEAAAKWTGAGLAALRQADTCAGEWADRLFSGQTGAFVWSVCEEALRPPRLQCWTVNQLTEEEQP